MPGSKRRYVRTQHDCSLLHLHNYLKDKICEFYYKRIKLTGSTESDVDHFYNNMLGLYFPRDQMYGIEQDSGPLPELNMKVKTDFTIRYVRSGQPKKVVVIECKRRSLESQDQVWRDALDQAIGYVKLIRMEKEQTASEPVFIIVAIGTYCRAYIHEQAANDAQPFKPHPNELLELERDEKKVHDVLTEINRVTQH